MVLTMRSGASSTVTGAIRSVNSRPVSSAAPLVDGPGMGIDIGALLGVGGCWAGLRVTTEPPTPKSAPSWRKSRLCIKRIKRPRNLLLTYFSPLLTH